MEKMITVTKKFIQKIGKHNFALIIFIFLILGIMGLYQTFSLYTSTGGMDIVEGIKTYKFILNDNAENSVTIAANSSKNISITIINPEEITLKYALYYSSNDSLEEINIGYLETSKYKGSELIAAGKEYTIDSKIYNHSDTDITINFGVKYGFENGGELLLEENQNYLEKYEIIYLSEVSEGSYVSYLGNNGCNAKNGSCIGRNANYVDDNNMGYCFDNTYQYNSNGWRVAYIEDSIPYLISGGSPECMCTDSDGTSSNSNCSSNETTNGTPLHHINLDDKALTYCNTEYAYEGNCNAGTAYSFDQDVYQIITGSSIYNCNNKKQNTACGYLNTLIDIGGYYWLRNSTTTTGNTYNWYESEKTIGENFLGGSLSNYNYGVRPILKLRSDILIIGGSGTYEEPYKIATNETKITDLSGKENHGISRNVTLDKTTGTATALADSKSFIEIGLENYDFKNDLSLVIRAQVEGNDISLIGNWENAGGGISISNGKLKFDLYIDDKNYEFYSDYTLQKDEWYTIVATYNGTNLAIYVNGKPIDLDFSIIEATNIASGNVKVSKVPFYVAGDPTDYGIGANSTSAGTFDDVLIFDRALTAEEIATNYSGEINDFDKSELLLHYNFE